MAAAARPLSFRIRADLFAQLAQMEVAGLPFDRAFTILNLPTIGQPRLEAMRKLTARGIDPAKAGERSGLFTKLEARLIGAALHAGSPANMYRRLADFYNDRATQLATMKSRLMMPALVLVLALLIKPLPMLIAGTIGIGGYVWKAAWPLLLIAGIVAVVRHLTGSDTRSGQKSLWQHVPLYGPMFIRRNLRDFFECLALLLEAGVSMLDALPAALDTVEDGDMRHDLGKIRALVESGLPLSEALHSAEYIREGKLIAFANTGEQSGTLPEMLMRYTTLETDAINSFWEQVALWTPRILYALLSLWMAAGILGGGGLMPKVPKEL